MNIYIFKTTNLFNKSLNEMRIRRLFNSYSSKFIKNYSATIANEEKKPLADDENSQRSRTRVQPTNNESSILKE